MKTPPTGTRSRPLWREGGKKQKRESSRHVGVELNIVGENLRHQKRDKKGKNTGRTLKTVKHNKKKDGVREQECDGPRS